MSDVSLLSREYRGVRKVSGPLLFVESASDLPYACTVSITGPSGPPRNGQVIEVSDDMTVVQVCRRLRRTILDSMAAPAAARNCVAPITASNSRRVI